MRVEIRRIRPDEGPLLMRVRLLALLDAPYAFAATYTDSIQRPAEEWARRAAAASAGGGQTIYLAHAPDDVIGMVGAYTPPDRPLTRVIWGVWVEPAYRAQSLGLRLVESVIAWGESSGADTLELWVAESNTPATELYRRLGFEDAGDTRSMESNPGVVERRLVRPAGRGLSA